MRFELRDRHSAKFWEPRCSGRSLTVRFGRIGTAGQDRRTWFATPAAARAALAKLVAEKRAKGYRPATATSRATPSSAATAAAGWTAPRRTALLQLATALGGAKAAAVGQEVALAADDPPRFLATTRRALFRGWDDDDTATLPWLALIEALEAARRLAEVDWKEAGSEVIAWLETIGGRAARRALAAKP